jgi:hypothetical protein
MYFTGLQGRGDLRPYLLLQILPILLVPLWQAIHGSDLNDHELLATFTFISGHAVKHLLATLAAGLIVGRLVQRIANAASGAQEDFPVPQTGNRMPGAGSDFSRQ